MHVSGSPRPAPLASDVSGSTASLPSPIAGRTRCTVILRLLVGVCSLGERLGRASLGLLLGLVSCGDPPGPPVARAPIGATSAPVVVTAAPSEAARAPEVSPASAPAAALFAPSAPVVPDYEQADLDAANDLVVAPPVPIDDCAKRLERAQIAFTPTELPLKREKVGRSGRTDVVSCGAEQVVVYLGGPAKIRYNAAPTLTCRMALALARFEEVAQEQSLKNLGQRIARFKHLGTYSCRKMVRFDFVSEHSYANAIDIEEILLDSGVRLSVKKNFGPLDSPPATRQAQFLRSLARRAFDERLFSTVLTPFWDNLHQDHFHLDLARYRVDGTRPN